MGRLVVKETGVKRFRFVYYGRVAVAVDVASVEFKRSVIAELSLFSHKLFSERVKNILRLLPDFCRQLL